VDMNELVTSGEASRLAGKSQRTISRWRVDGRLDPAGRNWRGWPLYSRSDVLALANLDHLTIDDAGGVT
jgi:DNA-binding transcriptional MerR regulator